MFVAALAVPHAFDSDAVLFGLAYFAVRAMHIVLFAEATPHVDVRQAAFRLARTAIPGPGADHRRRLPRRRRADRLWLLALTIDYAGPYVFGVRGFSVSADHFAERYGLIVIIALGESIVAIGIGAAGIELEPTVVVAAVLGLALACALWWAYFDIVALVARRKLVEAHGHARARLARDSLQLPPPADVRGHRPRRARREEGARPRERAAGNGAGLRALRGVALYLLSHDAIRYRSVRTINPRRCLAAATSAALIPVAVRVDGVVAIALVAAVCTALIAYETLRFRTARAQMRTAV